jgi:hypothetical protein
VLDNVTNWRVFNHDQHIIHFLTNEGGFHYNLINDEEHRKDLENFHEGTVMKDQIKFQRMWFYL